MSGIDKARETAQRLKGENEQAKKSEAVREAEIKNSLAVLANNSNLAKMYNDSASVGSENIGGESLPLLKVHSAGRSQNNLLLNGDEPHNGYFFHKTTQEEFKEVECHVLTISEGFRADGVENKKNVFNQILAGVVVNEGKFIPFLMYFTGMKLSNLWDFGKEASKWTKAKPIGIPLFAMKVKLTTRKEVDGAKSWFVVDFEIIKDESGIPILVTDEALFTVLRDNVDKVKATISKLIQMKATEDSAQMPRKEGFDSAGRKIDDIVMDEEPVSDATAIDPGPMPF